jgi:hypothetical protein
VARPHPSTSAIYAYAEDLRKQMLSDFDAVSNAEYDAAHDATNGIMLNERGRFAGISAWAVFAGSPVMDCYASEELLTWKADHPRTTRTEFEQRWLENYLGGSEAELVA